MKTIAIFAVLFARIPLTNASAADEVAPPRKFADLINDLKASPTDDSLREQIIKRALNMKRKPGLPEEAERRLARGKAAVKSAKTKGDFSEAADEFRKASDAAPWDAVAYFNLGIVLNKAEDFGGAARALKLYLLAAPNAPDAKKAKDLIYELEFRQEKADKERQDRAKRMTFEGEWYWKDTDGSWARYRIVGGDLTDLTLPAYIISRDSMGNFAIRLPEYPPPAPGYINNEDQYDHVSVSGRQLRFRDDQRPTRNPGIWVFEYQCTLSEDGLQLQCEHDYYFKGVFQGHSRNFTLYRKKS